MSLWHSFASQVTKLLLLTTKISVRYTHFVSARLGLDFAGKTSHVCLRFQSVYAWLDYFTGLRVANV